MKFTLFLVAAFIAVAIAQDSESDGDFDVELTEEIDWPSYFTAYLEGEGVKADELNGKSAPELNEMIINRLNQRLESANEDPELAELVKKHIEYFENLKKDL